MKAVVTGGRGFVGQYLVQALLEHGWRVEIFDKADNNDILDYESVRTFLDVQRPDAIFHLAAQAYVPESFVNPRRAFEVNTLGSLNILEAVRQLGIKTRIHLAGTSEEYGDAQYGEGMITEDAVPNPLSPYAISKLAMDQLGQLYAKSYGLPVVVTRAFNHTGAGRGEMYAESAFAKQIVEIEAGRRDVLEHGNLESVRNYTDVADIVQAYILAIDLEPGVYNICSDQNVSMQYVLDVLIGLSNTTISTKVNKSLYRPADFSFKTPSREKFMSAINDRGRVWSASISLEDTLDSILNHWRRKLS